MARKLDKLSVTLGKILTARGMQGRLHEYRIMQTWPGAVGPAIARHAQPAAIRGGKLTLIVDSPAWMQQLALLKPELIAKLNGRLGRETVRDIILKFGEVERRGDEPPAREADAAALTGEEKEKIGACVRGIGDQDVRDALRRLLEKDELRKKRKKS